MCFSDGDHPKFSYQTLNRSGPSIEAGPTRLHTASNSHQFAHKYGPTATYSENVQVFAPDNGLRYPYQRLGDTGSYGDVEAHQERHNFHSRRFAREDVHRGGEHTPLQRFSASGVASASVLGPCSKGRIVSGNYYVSTSISGSQPAPYQQNNFVPASVPSKAAFSLAYSPPGSLQTVQTEVRKRTVQVPVTVMQEQVIEERVQVNRSAGRQSDVA